MFRLFLVLSLGLTGLALTGCDDDDAEIEVPGAEVEIDKD